jgi:cutinase
MRANGKTQGMLIGPQLQSALSRQLPGMKTFPVLYAASIATNVSPARTDDASIKKGVDAFNNARACSVLVAGGYSQGAAVMHNVIGKSLSADIKAKIAGVALFGDTRNKQDSGHIPNFPTERSKVWCNPNDGVCGGGLNVNAGHMSYSGKQINEAASYLAGLAKRGGAGASAGGMGGMGGMAKGGKGGKAPGGAAPKAGGASPKAGGASPKAGGAMPKGDHGAHGGDAPAAPAAPAAEDSE